MVWTEEGYEAEIVWHFFGWRIRLYLGHTGVPKRRIVTWKSTFGTPSRGIFVVPWGYRAIGAQIRKAR